MEDFGTDDYYCYAFLGEVTTSQLLTILKATARATKSNFHLDVSKKYDYILAQDWRRKVISAKGTFSKLDLSVNFSLDNNWPFFYFRSLQFDIVQDERLSEYIYDLQSELHKTEVDRFYNKHPKLTKIITKV